MGEESFGKTGCRECHPLQTRGGVCASKDVRRTGDSPTEDAFGSSMTVGDGASTSRKTKAGLAPDLFVSLFVYDTVGETVEDLRGLVYVLDDLIHTHKGGECQEETADEPAHNGGGLVGDVLI